MQRSDCGGRYSNTGSHSSLGSVIDNIIDDEDDVDTETSVLVCTSFVT